MTDKEAFFAAFDTVDPNLGQMLRAHGEHASLAMIKMRLRAAVAKAVRVHGDDQIRDELADILQTIADEGLHQPRDLDVALDAVLCTAGHEI